MDQSKKKKDWSVPTDHSIDKQTKNDTDGITIPTNYPNHRFEGCRTSCPDDESVIQGKDWVDENIK